MSERARVAILISGRGSNMVALVEAMQAGRVPAEPALVLSNVPDAPGLERARALGVPTAVLDSRVVKPRAEHERRLAARLEAERIDVVCLAGYMRLLSPWLVERFRGRILNVHPSLLPAFPGLEAQQQALEHGVKLAGCTVHLVDEECDQGPIVAQAAVPVHEEDDVDALSARILAEEHRIYPEALRMLLEGRVRVEGRRTRCRAAAGG